jgi:methionyl aminopeptidase
MITIKTSAEIKTLSEGGKILASILNQLASLAKPGVATFDLEKEARKLIKQAGGQPAFLNYSPWDTSAKYPAALCVAINDEVVHGIPKKDRILKNGDIVGLDLGLQYKKLFTDMAMTVGVGKISDRAKELMRVTEESLFKGIKEIKAGARLGDYGFVVQQFVESRGFHVVTELVGHGVGYLPHEDPDIPNWGRKGKGIELKEGMVLALEPMVCEGSGAVFLDKDGWTWKTRNGLLSAHFEHTIVVEKEGCKILTK